MKQITILQLISYKLNIKKRGVTNKALKQHLQIKIKPHHLDLKCSQSQRTAPLLRNAFWTKIENHQDLSFFSFHEYLA